MGRELTMGVSSTKLDRQQQNFSGHILLSWSVVLQVAMARYIEYRDIEVVYAIKK